MPRLRKFNRDLKILNTVLTDLIARAKSSESKADLEDLQARNYDKVRSDGVGWFHNLPLSMQSGVPVCGFGASVCWLYRITPVGMRFGRVCVLSCAGWGGGGSLSCCPSFESLLH